MKYKPGDFVLFSSKKYGDDDGKVLEIYPDGEYLVLFYGKNSMGNLIAKNERMLETELRPRPWGCYVCKNESFEHRLCNIGELYTRWREFVELSLFRIAESEKKDPNTKYEINRIRLGNTCFDCAASPGPVDKKFIPESWLRTPLMFDKEYADITENYIRYLFAYYRRGGIFPRWIKESGLDEVNLAKLCILAQDRASNAAQSEDRIRRSSRNKENFNVDIENFKYGGLRGQEAYELWLMKNH